VFYLIFLKSFLPILSAANINSFFKTTNLFGMSLDKVNKYENTNYKSYVSTKKINDAIAALPIWNLRKFTFSKVSFPQWWKSLQPF